MKKIWFTRLLILLVVLVMVIPMVACGDKGKPSKQEEASKGKEEGKKDDAEKDEEKKDEGKKDEELEFVTFDWYIGQDQKPDHQLINDAINEYLKEEINANVNMHFWPAKDWEEKMPTMLSAGQDVGVIGFGSQAKLDYVVQATRGSFAPLNDLLDEYGEGTKALFSSDVWDAMKIDGNIYGIPSLKDNCYIMSLVYNADMAEALELDMDNLEYKNFRQLGPFFEEVLEKRAEKFPEYDELYPLCNISGAESPYNFAIESFLRDSYIVACNIDPFFDIAAYDDNTVFNLYDTDEYKEFCKQRFQWVQDNIIAYKHEGEWNYTGGMFGWAGWGYAYMQEHLYGEKFTTKMVVSENIWTDTNNYFSAGTAIAANCAEKERAMMMLELVNNDPYFATTMRFGLEGTHYIINDEGKMQFEGSERNVGDQSDWGYYYWYAAPIGNLTIVNAPEDLVGPDGIMLDELVRYNNEAVIPRHMGFSLDTTPITNEIAACTNVVMEYRDDLRNGRLESIEVIEKQIEDFNAKLKANGVDKIIEETQKQIDEWNAAQ
ncbi:MAG: ABC transporter substrate-binding protein [Clostridiales bacterium]|nr:ABC transporter substrate-binding protein [Clostridiales bacterium]